MSDVPTAATSEPLYEEIRILDVDLGFASGHMEPLMLYPDRGDRITEGPDYLTITLPDGESFTAYKSHLAWVRKRPGVIRRKVEGPPSRPPASESSDSPAPASPQDR